MGNDEIIRKIAAAKAAAEELDLARRKAEQEAEQEAEKQEARMRWARQEVLNKLRMVNPFDYSPYDIDKVSDLDAMLWLKQWDEQHKSGVQ